MNIKEALQESILKLKENNVEEANDKARRILAHILDVNKEYLIINDNKALSEDVQTQYTQSIENLISGIPIQYIIGKQEFMGISFKVNENVLIPQPDTETLVEKAIEIAKRYSSPKILDLCTGSGAIAIAIKKYVPESIVFASDISKDALEVARENDRKSEIKFINSNLFEDINGKFNIIVSNPPYIKTEEIKTLSEEVQNEPKLALDGGIDGLKFYREIITKAHYFLEEQGSLCLEIGEDQKEDIVKIIKQNENYTNIKTYKDMGGNDRVVICEKKQNTTK